MHPARWQHVERIYHEAQARPAGDRAAFLAEACAGDQDLRREVGLLLAQGASADEFLSRGVMRQAVSGGPALLTGRRLGVYHVQEQIGAGGMGEVYRARDTRLGRDVAIKILPPLFTADPGRLARFEREARVLAALNHPNIATIHGVEDSDGVHALVLELVDGETLADRIARGPMRVSDALAIATQIADALDAAHEKGVIHRDLKPANIKITPGGTVKVLDFGLAKAIHADGPDGGPSNAPTMTVGGTGEGVIVGTAAYMSPEQARGLAVDKRTDIWAFGCVLYEMLTGRTAFRGETISDTIAAILEREPEWDALPPSVPGRLRDLLRRCLRKDPKRRLRDAGDAINDIAEVLNPSIANLAATGEPRPASVGRLAAVAVPALLLGAVLTGAAAWIAMPWVSSSAHLVTRFVATSGPADALQLSGLDRDIAISPDGTHVAYMAGEPGRVRLVTRALAQLETRLLSDSGAPRAPFFSPDSQWVGFFELFGAVRKISTAGGPATDVSRSVGGAARGASWSSDDTIIFATTDPGTGLWRIPAAGGEPEVLTHPDATARELDHFWPEVLPGGRAVLFTIVSAGSADSAQIAVLDLGSGRRKVLIRGGTHAQYAPPGHLMYGAGGSLYAVRFDVDRLEVTGEAIKVVEQVVITPEGAVNAAMSQDGTLAYVRGGMQGAVRTLVWVTRGGREDPIAAPPRPYVYPRLSPDGRRIAVEVWDQDRDIWVWDLVRETLTRVTDNPGRDGFPLWSPDGQRLMFGSTRDASTNLFWRAADGTGAVQRLTESPKIQFPYSVSPDGTRLVIREDDPETRLDISVVSLIGERRTAPLIRAAFNEQNAEISPDARWIAYQSNESGQDEVYVRPFPAVGDSRWQVSTAGGTRPLWARNGRELFYLAPDGFSSVSVGAGTEFSAGRPVRLFEYRYFAETAFIGRTYDVSLDGQRFLMIKEPGTAVPPQIVIVQNWRDELRRLAAP